LNIAKIKLQQFQAEIEDKIKNHTINLGLGELRNLIAIAILIVQHSLDRNENRGGFVKIELKK
jgi:L-aspartate oxidase